MKCACPGCLKNARKSRFAPAKYCSHACRMKAMRLRKFFGDPPHVEELIYRARRACDAMSRYHETRTIQSFVNLQTRMDELANCALLVAPPQPRRGSRIGVPAAPGGEGRGG